MSERPFTDRERALVQSLTELAALGATKSIDLDRDHKRAVERAERVWREACRAIADRHAVERRAAEREHRDRMESLRKRHGADRKETIGTATSIRREIVEKGESSETKVGKQHQEAVWLAESVYEGHEHQPEEQYNQLRAELLRHREELRSIEARAGQFMRQARMAATRAPDQADARPADDPIETLRSARRHAEKSFAQLQSLTSAKIFRGFAPFVFGISGIAIPIAIVAYFRKFQLDQWVWITTGIASTVVIGSGLAMYFVGRRRARTHLADIQSRRVEAEATIDAALTLAKETREAEEERLVDQRDRDLGQANDRHERVMAEVEERRQRYFREIEERRESQLTRIDEMLERGLHEEETAWTRCKEQMAIDHRHEVEEHERQHEQEKAERQREYEAAWNDLETRWSDGMRHASNEITSVHDQNASLFPAWDASSWRDWRPSSDFTPMVRFGEVRVDLRRLPSGLPEHKRLPIDGQANFDLPCMIEFPGACSMLLETGPEGRDDAIRSLQTLMFRLLTSVPPGKVRFTIFDPVGLGQNFAGFMHLADYDGQLVADRIWTDQRHIEQRLADLTDHMENVIQKYLRNEFETIDEYNLKAGEIAEPYRFLVVADLPVNFTETASRRLASIINSGARCGVYTLLVTDPGQRLPPGLSLPEIERRSITLVHEGDRFVWDDEDFRKLDLCLDEPPAEGFITRTLHDVGAAARDSNRVEVPFDVVAPNDEELWTASCSDQLKVPLGRSGASKLQELALGRGTSQHALIAGKTGSGKSTLLHVIISNLALWYSPDEVEMYLIDFKKGVEFKAYATDEIPHVRVVGVETDREFGLSVFHRVDQEMKRRGELFRDLSVQDIAGYRRVSAEPMPRTLLIVDEFQEMFVEDDKVGQEAALLLDRLVRQGRAFGIHVILGSQTLGGAYSLARSTIGQMAVRIALQCNEADSYLILSEDNSAARLLARPGEAIYNDAGGLIEGNSPFQIVWLSEEMRERAMGRIADAARERGVDRPPQIVFEGNIPGDITRNPQLRELVRADGWPAHTTVARAYFGDAIAIKDPTNAPFRRQSGSNVLVVGQRDESALSVMGGAMLSLSLQHAPDRATFYVLDGTPADSPFTGTLTSLVGHLPHSIHFIEWRDVPEAIDELRQALDQRERANETDGYPIYLFVHGLQRYRMLRHVDDYGFGSKSADEGPQPEKQFAEILAEGPNFGIHTLAWVDTYSHATRALERRGIGEFTMRVLFQMSGPDSTSLIDSPAASKLGMQRALFFHEEHGTLEKFRPYSLPPAGWLKELGTAAAGRA